MKILLLALFSILLVQGCNNPPIDPPPVVVPTSEPTLPPIPNPTPEPSPSPLPPVDVDSLFSATEGARAQVRVHVEKFIEDGKSIGVDIVLKLQQAPKLEIRVASLDWVGPGVIGLCQMTPDYRIITYDPDFFNTGDALQDRILSHHEMGHCVLYRGHRTDIGVIPDGLGHTHELSVMYPYIMYPPRYAQHELWYVSELFSFMELLQFFDDSVDTTTPPTKTYICN